MIVNPGKMRDEPSERVREPRPIDKLQKDRAQIRSTTSSTGHQSAAMVSRSPPGLAIPFEVAATPSAEGSSSVKSSSGRRAYCRPSSVGGHEYLVARKNAGAAHARAGRRQAAAGRRRPRRGEGSYLLTSQCGHGAAGPETGPGLARK
jgi:hypothetical protein